MKRIVRILLAALAVIQAISVAPQAQLGQHAACDTSNRRPQSRFYQRGFAPDDQTEDDLWRFSDLEAQGIDRTIVDGGLALLAESPTRQSLILMRNGYVVHEAYFNGSRATDSNNIASVSKSMLSALIGIAIEQRHFQSTDDRIADYLPEYFKVVCRSETARADAPPDADDDTWAGLGRKWNRALTQPQRQLGGGYFELAPSATIPGRVSITALAHRR